MICLSGFADLRLFFFPGQIFRFLTMVRASWIPLRTAFAWGIPMAAERFDHCRPPFFKVIAGPWLNPAARSLPAVS